MAASSLRRCEFDILAALASCSRRNLRIFLKSMTSAAMIAAYPMTSPPMDTGVVAGTSTSGRRPSRPSQEKAHEATTATMATTMTIHQMRRHFLYSSSCLVCALSTAARFCAATRSSRCLSLSFCSCCLRVALAEGWCTLAAALAFGLALADDLRDEPVCLSLVLRWFIGFRCVMCVLAFRCAGCKVFPTIPAIGR